MTLGDYRACLAIARRHARSAADARDLLHEALLAGALVGRTDFSEDGDRAWLAGAIRNIAAETARGESRRRTREARWAQELPAAAVEPQAAANADDILARLSEGTRRIAVLALHGLNADEIQYVLGLKPPAFRQRLTALRRALGTHDPDGHLLAIETRG
ncbi:MAG: RNA polymerase sigma factor [Gammaproteobacteria bacterium]